MGRNIDKSSYSQAEFEAFSRVLKAETDQLLRLFVTESLAPSHTNMCGIELEAWVTDDQFNPLPITDTILESMPHSQVTPELSKFHLEILTKPHQIEHGVLKALDNDLTKTWDHCQKIASQHQANLLSIGSLPTITQNHLTEKYRHPSERYTALNNQLKKLRGNQPIAIDIQGKEHLKFTQEDVMIVAITTSLQVHFKVDQQQSVRCYNAAQILSPLMVAVAANSPFLFGKQLWDETRIAIFEQSLPCVEQNKAKTYRVSLGNDYVHSSLMELFIENLQQFPVIFPIVFDEEDRFLHVCLHNGSIWRWNRPIVGFDAADGGKPHLRIEHRVMPAGPSAVDNLANIAFFIGLLAYYTNCDIAPETQLKFSDLKKNFYQAARISLDSEVMWLGGKTISMQQLLLDEIDHAKLGLSRLNFDPTEVDRYLNVIRQRVKKKQHGANWQKKYIEKYGKDFNKMMKVYYDYQQQNIPVHEWEI